MSYKSHLLAKIALKVALIAVFSSFNFNEARAQSYNDSGEIFQNKIYDRDIHTVLLNPTGQEMAPPVIQLGHNEQLELQFDDLSSQMRNWNYTIVQCNEDWSLSDQQQSMYLQGFYDNPINKYDYSFNTLESYVHFHLDFPNEQLKITQSGNYLLRVYQVGDTSKRAFDIRFMIQEPLLSFDAVVKPPDLVSQRETDQQLNFTIHLNNANVRNPYSDLYVEVLQNRRYDNAKKGLKPQFLKGTDLEYNYSNGETTFQGGNEYRFFNIGSIRFRSEQVHDIVMGDSLYNVILSPYGSRAFIQYSYYNDIDGRYVIRNSDGTDPTTDADYVKVHFKLPVDAPFTGGSIYVFGDLSFNRFLPEFKMKYVAADHAYERVILLKQGYYDYVYNFLPDGSHAGDVSRIEGTHYITENEYTILVYYRDIAARCDRLIGYKVLKSIPSSSH